MDIKELKSKPHLSATSIRTYIECGLSYRFSHIDRIKPEFIPDSLVFGSVIHKTLAELNNVKMMGNKLPLIDFLSYLIDGKDLLSTYYQKTPDDHYRIIAIEEPFSFSIPDLPIPIIGI